MMIHRRMALRIPLAAAAGTLAATLWRRKPNAAAVTLTADGEALSPLSEALQKVSPPAEAPDAVFVSADGKTHHLSEFKGRGMVVNMWATWCSPCVAEMPSLAALSKALAPADIAVLPLSSDRGGADVVSAWYQDHGIIGLPVLLDPKGALARAFEARGIPTTVIINKDGRVAARLEGAADWSSPQAQALIRSLAG